ncbi:uncharacterized protein BCR38DRAFT_404976 [Pseudomassariella vexata]|uniref:Ams2/SPT21 N-terminal domain-containing protein n=1 Tax=Pseudomassariella vexata TaxID=1141098 RepID=A0A1Y2EK88_9PEZI|nr:uncharacterized protein BCR38DRAFT_404976 [Pseudomassariella vexata]ORY71952.1 hypothetical protein BCR38DRAFT_404976 [Pseudomassariella vexata]
MANNNNNNNNAHWGPPPIGPEDVEMQTTAMGLKVHYSFDRDNAINCLARWPHTLHVQTIAIDERNTIGVLDLRTCVQAVAQCSPELVGDSGQDYTVYAYDYSEPDTPLVGQGMLCWALEQGPGGDASQKLVTGRVTKNVLAIFGNGVRETLEVKLRLTAVRKIARANPTPTPGPTSNMESVPSLNNSVSIMSESAEWRAFMQSNPNLGHRGNVSAMSSPGLAPARLYNAGFDARNDMMRPTSQGFLAATSSRPASVEPNTNGNATTQGNQAGPEGLNPAPADGKANKPKSRAGSKAPTGRPRGRPRKNPLPGEGSTSGYEDGTDADDGPPQKKRRAKTTQVVERSNTATFGSAPESLRVAASTSGSLRTFRPVGPGRDGPTGNHLQEGPRAPTPVPERQLPGPSNSRSSGSSTLRRHSVTAQDQAGSFMTSSLEVSRFMSQNQDAQSPMDSIAPSPSQYSDASPADIGSSPPVPRAMYSIRSSPNPPSSPILPPMPMPQIQPDSGFMSGGLDDAPQGDDASNIFEKPGVQAPPAAPALAKPKPKRSRAKKQQPTKAKDIAKDQDNFVYHSETPGDPTLLPTTSIYTGPPPPNPTRSRKPAAKAKVQTQSKSIPPVTEQPGLPPLLQKSTSEITTLTELAANKISQVLPRPEIATITDASAQLKVRTTRELPAQVDVNTPEEPPTQPERLTTAAIPSQPAPDTNASLKLEALEENPSGFNARLLASLNDDDDDQFFDGLIVEEQSFAPAEDHQARDSNLHSTAEPAYSPMLPPPPASRAIEESNPEPELPPMAQVPASDLAMPRLTLPMPPTISISEASHPQAEMFDLADARNSKNIVKRQAIKQKLDEAVAKGELPPFCTNCGAVQTPTWRKIWKQEHTGVPDYHEYSEKPGHVTAINVLERDHEGKPCLYEMVKKTLGPNEDKTLWNEVLLCNPCGIWFSKWKAPRPPEKWERDQDRLQQVRNRKRSAGAQTLRQKKPRTKSGSQMNLTSEIGFSTDPTGPFEGSCSPGTELADPFTSNPHPLNSRQGSMVNLQGPGSTHSRGSGTPGSPIALDDDDLGCTRRVLFPSPQKDGRQRVMGEVTVNVMRAEPNFQAPKEREDEGEKENRRITAQHHESDDFADLFGTAPARPSTPPPKSSHSEPFKTPTRPTPSHRPITRSVTRSIRSSRSAKSPSQLLSGLQRTPSRTPRSTTMSSALRRGSPRNVNMSSHLNDNLFESPFTKSINQLLSDANDFIAPSPHRGFELDLSHLPHMDSDGLLVPGGHFDFGNLLSTDVVMPSSSPTRHGHEHLQVSFGSHLVYNDGTAEAELWRQLSVGTSGAGAGVDNTDAPEELEEEAKH